jgi:hypothetical protein
MSRHRELFVVSGSPEDALLASQHALRRLRYWSEPAPSRTSDRLHAYKQGDWHHWEMNWVIVASSHPGSTVLELSGASLASDRSNPGI